MTESFKNNEGHASVENKKNRAVDILKKELKSAWDRYKWGIPICLFIFICAVLYELIKKM